MKQMIYSVMDSKVKVFTQPFNRRNANEALRDWQNTVNDPQSPFGRHPGDYTLFEIGVFDDETGQIQMHESFTNLGNGLQFKQTEGNQQ